MDLGLSDSVVLLPVNDTTTSFQAIRHRKSLVGSPDDSERYVMDLYGSLVARVSGLPLPTYEKK